MRHALIAIRVYGGWGVMRRNLRTDQNVGTPLATFNTYDEAIAWTRTDIAKSMREPEVVPVTRTLWGIAV